MSSEHHLFVVGPTSLAILNEAIALSADLPWGKDGALEVWSDSPRVFAFSDDPEIAARAAVAIAETMDTQAIAPTSDGEAALQPAACSLLAAAVGTTAAEDGTPTCTGSITHYAMNADGESVTINTLSLTYDEEAADLSELLDIEIMDLLEIGDELTRLGQQDDDSSA